ncbi:MAG: SoxR reducing system RseC family protein [Alphaproteobacteria bacterium]|nr:SoxR reducing system RseC family protein [Alphaproteobacteria bacterium]
MQAEDDLPDPSNYAAVEGLAKVVSIQGAVAWLEPEQTTSCGGCASSQVCGADVFGSRLHARRFPLDNVHELKVGDRVVVGVQESMLVRASMTAYAIPLVTLLGGGTTAHLLGYGDGVTILATLAGLALGLLLARLRAKSLSAKGELTPIYLRHAPSPAQSESCQLN